MTKVIALALVFLLLLLMAYIRFAPSDPERWNVDPLTAPDPAPGGVKLVPPDVPVYQTSPDQLMAAIENIALATPRTKQLAGSVELGQVTYETRSALWGFPDYITVRVLPDTERDGATLAVVSRLRFGQGDLGVNQKRLQSWLAQLDQQFGRIE